ncbi:ATP-binding protein [Streptomonospora wellingtoniae]|uniref:ATP-binding protein n=1 Tax=Streptomonospora wellingtoniae TaxID=3075544 RepID=A0ABU2KUH6_9ACTN|nr:ATP-binding protein [Streptomonospora sp. DSM 45055]MDT0302934.1 ATP-binding protein [Streptomonospora sp. DSM 45055]
MPDPIIRVEDLTDDYDPYLVDESREQAAKRITKQIPLRYKDATADHPDIAQWVRDIVTHAVTEQRGVCVAVESGPSLTLLGPTGTGKTHLAYGAMNALAASGVRLRWEMSTAADIYARLRPRHQVDSEAEFREIAGAPLLVIDDLGAAKDSEWTEEINYRLINHRYERVMPTLITSNVPVNELKTKLGERVNSRLREMTSRVVLEGQDRRGRAA